MKVKNTLFLLAALALCVAPGTHADEPPSGNAFASYLGQRPPGDTAELLAPGILPVEGIQHCFPAFSADGRAVYWTVVTREEGGRPHSTIWYMEIAGNGWTQPSVAPFSGEYSDQNPYVGFDNRRVYFSSNRPGGHGRARNVWYVERSDTGWGEPVNLGAPPNSDIGVSQMTLTASGTAYFVGRMDGTQWKTGIYRSRLVDGTYLPPEPLAAPIVTEHADVYPFIAPDESYLLFGSTRPGGASSETDLYISFRNVDDTWGEPIRFDERINSGKTVSFACVTHDGRFLIFNRFDDDGTDKFYWIDAGIIEQCRPAR